MAVFWVVAPCSLVEVYQLIALMMGTAKAPETLVNFYQTTRRYNQENSQLRTHRRENLKSYTFNHFYGCFNTDYYIQINSNYGTFYVFL
jgi:hypothetical protein